MPTIEELEKTIEKLQKEASAAKTSAEVEKLMTERKADVAEFLKDSPLVKEPAAEITFSEPGQADQKASVTWEKFLVGLPAEQYNAFKKLSGGGKNIAIQHASSTSGGLNFSEFDTTTGGAGQSGGLDLSEGDTQSALKKARDAYRRGVVA